MQVGWEISGCAPLRVCWRSEDIIYWNWQSWPGITGQDSSFNASVKITRKTQARSGFIHIWKYLHTGLIEDKRKKVTLCSCHCKEMQICSVWMQHNFSPNTKSHNKAEGKIVTYDYCSLHMLYSHSMCRLRRRGVTIWLHNLSPQVQLLLDPPTH